MLGMVNRVTSSGYSFVMSIASCNSILGSVQLCNIFISANEVMFPPVLSVCLSVMLIN